MAGGELEKLMEQCKASTSFLCEADVWLPQDRLARPWEKEHGLALLLGCANRVGSLVRCKFRGMGVLGTSIRHKLND